MRKKDIGILIVIILLCSFGIFKSLNGQGFETEIYNNELIYLDAQQANDIGYIVETQNFFDTQQNYPFQYTTDEFSLIGGEYRITIDYNITQDTTAYIYSHAGRYREIMSDNVKLDRYKHTVNFNINLKHGVSDLQVRINDSGNGEVLINRISIIKISNTLRKVFSSLCILITATWILLLINRIREKKIGLQTISIVLGLFIITLLASIPILLKGIIETHRFIDLSFHLWRIESIAAGIKAGQIPVRIYPLVINGYGYPNGIFYGDTLLYIPAILRIIGYSITGSYKIFLILINFFTAFIGYWCFKKITNRFEVGILISAVLTLSPYRLANVYDRCAMGEYIAMMFLPLAVCGLWMIFCESNFYTVKEGITALVIGATGIIQSHILSVVMVCAYGIIFIIWFWRITFTKKTITALLKTIFCIIALNLWFIVPFLDYMLTQQVNVIQSTIYKIQKEGLEVPSLGGILLGDRFIPRGMGIVFLLVPVCFIGIWIWCHYKNVIISDINALKGILLIGLLFIYLALDIFPYDYLCKNSSIFNRFVGILQFPWRWLGLAGIILALLLSYILFYAKNINLRLYTGLMLGISFIVLIQTIYIETRVIDGNNRVEYYDTAGMRQEFLDQVSRGEYLLKGTEYPLLDGKEQILVSGSSELTYQRNGNKFKLFVNKVSKSETLIDLPLFFYKGYTVNTYPEDDSVTLKTGENNVITVIIPPNFKGEIDIGFSEPWYWKVAGMISLFGVVGFIVYDGYSKRKFNRKIGQRAKK